MSSDKPLSLNSSFSSSSTQLLFPRRIIIVLLCFLSNLMCYADRANMSISILFLPYSSAHAGIILSAFYWGYISTQMFASSFAHYFGAKCVLLLGVFTWTLFDFSTIFAARNLWVLLACRVGMGFGQGVNFPCLHQLASVWFPKNERSRLMAMVSAGTDIGNIVSVVASPIIAANFGWTFIHISFAGLNVIWLVLFAVFGASAPHVDRRISEVEKNFIARETSPMRRRASVENRNVILQVCSASPWRELIFNSKTAAICISQTCFGFGWYIFLSWLPRYLQDGIGLDLSSKSFLAALPYFIGFVGLLLSGMLSDYIISKEIISTLNCRKLFNTVGSLGPAVCLFVLPVINDELTAITLLCISMFLARFSVCGHNINIIDVAPQHAGQLLGFCNTIGTFSGIAANILTGKILEQTGSWKLIFWIPAVLNIIGSIVFLIFADIEPIIPIEDDLLNGPEAENLISA